MEEPVARIDLSGLNRTIRGLFTSPGAHHLRGRCSLAATARIVTFIPLRSVIWVKEDL
jgi:hypothetical protein